MVKNTGGCKTKGLARKLVNAPVNSKLRLPEDECECYAKVLKMLGNGMCHVNLVYKDNLFQNVICHIRGKFRNRNKRSNLVSNGDTLLVGIRDWESNIENCDLLFIYNIQLINLLSLPSILISHESSKHESSEHDNISFDNNIHNHINLSNTPNIIKNNENENENENEINFNDI
jgi:translation initiation factor IF-1